MFFCSLVTFFFIFSMLSFFLTNKDEYIYIACDLFNRYCISQIKSNMTLITVDNIAIGALALLVGRQEGTRPVIPALLLICRPRKDDRLSWPSWLTCSGWFTDISGHPSAAGRAQDRESSPVRDRRSSTTTVLRHQP